ncbi:hypothetical protein BH10ACT11_BH10ACT11_09790 [soil metagenome]
MFSSYSRLCALAAIVVSSAVLVTPSSAAQIVTAVTPIPYSPPPGAKALSTTGCPDQNACTWGQSDYDGQRTVFDSSYAGQWQTFSDYRRNSAKNRFDNRKFKLGRVSSSGITVIACLDPGANRPDPGYFDAFLISDSGSDHCG